MKKIISNYPSSALLGMAFVLPFLLLNWVVGNNIEPFMSIMRPDGHTSIREYFMLGAVLLLLPIGAWIALRPVLLAGPKSQQKIIVVNLAIAASLVVGFVAISVGLGSDIYRCDVQQIQNCD